jgi:hypothetical protein
MPETDSSLSTTSSIISIVTLVYAITLTIEVYVKALHQTELDTDALMQSLSQSMMGLEEIHKVLEKFAKIGSQNVGDGRSPNDWALQMLMEKLEKTGKIGRRCVEDWQAFERQKPIRKKLNYVLVVSIHRASYVENWGQSRRDAVTLGRKLIFWFGTFFFFGIVLPIYLPIALLYNIGAVVHSVLFYNVFVFRLRMMRTQTSIANRMQKVGSSLTELRSQVLLR